MSLRGSRVDLLPRELCEMGAWMLSGGWGLKSLFGLSGLLLGAPEASLPADTASQATTAPEPDVERTTPEGGVSQGPASEHPETVRQLEAPAAPDSGGESTADGLLLGATPESGPGEDDAAAVDPALAEPHATPYSDWMPIHRDSIFDAGYGTRGQVTIALGGLYDALDPRAAAGASLRVPQFTSDARFGLGKGWSVTAHLNTILAINELDAGMSFSFPLIGEIRGVAQFQAGVHLGMLGSFGFESLIVAPEFRPLIGLSLPIASMRWSLRGELVFAGPYVASLGGATNTLSTPPPLANWNIALVLENLLKNDRLWYAGVMMMGSTAIYQNWLLFPDTSHYDFYPRVVGGYEF